jgi:hypothetical protein
MERYLFCAVVVRKRVLAVTTRSLSVLCPFSLPYLEVVKILSGDVSIRNVGTGNRS